MMEDIKARDNVVTDYSELATQRIAEVRAKYSFNEVSDQISLSVNKEGMTAWEANREVLSQANRQRTAMLRQKLYGGEEVLFGQRRISSHFRDIGSDAPDYLRGRSIYDVAEELKSGKIRPNQIRIEAFEFDGKLVAATNRGLAALSLAGFKPTNVIKRAATEAEKRRLRERPLTKFQTLPGRKTYVTKGENNLKIEDEINLPY